MHAARRHHAHPTVHAARRHHAHPAVVPVIRAPVNGRRVVYYRAHGRDAYHGCDAPYGSASLYNRLYPYAHLALHLPHGVAVPGHTHTRKGGRGRFRCGGRVSIDVRTCVVSCVRVASMGPKCTLLLYGCRHGQAHASAVQLFTRWCAVSLLGRGTRVGSHARER